MTLSPLVGALWETSLRNASRAAAGHTCCAIPFASLSDGYTQTTTAVRSAVPTERLRKVPRAEIPCFERLYIATEKPPSTGMAVPVTKSDAGLARNAATPAMSGGVPQRPMGVRFSTLSCRP